MASAVLLQAAQHLVRTEAVTNQIQIWWWCILIARYHANQNSYAELIVLKDQSECRTLRRSVATWLDVLGNDKLVANNVLNELQATRHGWSMPLTRKFGHIHLTLNSKSIFFSKSKIIKLHRHFKHPTSGKLYEVMMRALPNQVDEANRQQLEQMSE